MAASRGRVLERLRARLSFFEAAPCFRTVRHVLIALIAPPSTVVQLTSIRCSRAPLAPARTRSLPSRAAAYWLTEWSCHRLRTAEAGCRYSGSLLYAIYIL